MWNPPLWALHNQGCGPKSGNCIWRRHLKKNQPNNSVVYIPSSQQIGLFSFCFRRKSLGNPLPLSKEPLNQIGGQLHLQMFNVQIHRKQDFRHSVWLLCSCDTCNCVRVRSKAKQKLVVPVVERETSKESTIVTESGGETEPSEPQFSLCSELGAAAFPVSDKSPAHSTSQYH